MLIGIINEIIRIAFGYYFLDWSLITVSEFRSNTYNYLTFCFRPLLMSCRRYLPSNRDVRLAMSSVRLGDRDQFIVYSFIPDCRWHDPPRWRHSRSFSTSHFVDHYYSISVNMLVRKQDHIACNVCQITKNL